MASKKTFLLLLVLFYLHFFTAALVLSLQTTNLNSNNSRNKIRRSGCIEFERKALLKFKQGLEDPSGRLFSWAENDCCRWSGVGCNHQIGRVTKLNLRNPYVVLSYENASDVAAYDLSCLRGNINPFLLNLQFLNYLDLSNNNFQNIPIPSFLGSLKQLSYLNLSYASFDGLVSSHLGNLSNLRYLDLSFTNVWVFDLNFISGLHYLKHLNLESVNLSLASTNWLQVVNMLPSLLELHLRNCQLDYFPQSFSFVNFTSLSVLDLSSNYLFNSSIPPWIFNISTLTELKLQSCGLNNSIYEAKWENLCSLQTLDLSFGGIQGEMEKFVESLSQCSIRSLKSLDLSYNQITGYLPNSLISFQYLKYFGLSHNLLSGPIPTSIGNLSHQEYLDLSVNNMNGTIPESVGQIRELQVLDLFYNSWEGIISEAFFQNLTKLKSLSLSHASQSFALKVTQNWIPPFSLLDIQITDCTLGPSFPVWLSSQKELISITLRNVGILDLVPDWLWKLAPQLEFLDLSRNQLGGKLPKSLQFSRAAVHLGFNNLEGLLPHWSNLYSLSLKNNHFSGSIPSNINQGITELKALDLSGNFLNGSIPSSISMLTNLVYLDLSNNHFYGKMFTRWKVMEQLQVVNLSRNNLSGGIPHSMCSQLPYLSWLMLSKNNISGKLSSPRNCKHLFRIDLGENKFFGFIPKWIAQNLPQLKELRLRENLFTGTIPEHLCHLSNLHALDFAINNLSRSIPRCMGKLIALQRFHLYEKHDPRSILFYYGVMELFFKGQPVELISNQIGIANSIDLSRNYIKGLIPEEITNLTTLGTLNLSWNQLTGPIPENIENLRLLETLNLSCNHLSGVIPPSMTSMTLLSHLNLSHNNLSGKIPTANQFLTFSTDPSIYEGNLRLCGPPLANNCSAFKGEDVEDNDYKVKDEDEYDMLRLYTSMAMGFATGFWAVCGTLVIKKS